MGNPRNGRTGPLPMPADFAARAKSMTIRETEGTWGCGKGVALRWRTEAGLVGRVGRPEVSAAEIQHLTDTMTQEKAAEHVGVSIVTFRKMQRAAGVTISQTRTVAQRVAVRQERIERQERSVSPNPNAEAARAFLQGKRPIWHCDADRTFNATGAFFMFDGKVHDAQQIVDKALSMGWQPDAWQKLAVAA